LNRKRGRQAIAGARIAAGAAQDIGDDAIPVRPTDNALISLGTAKEKIWKSLEKLGKAWKSLEFPWNFLGISLEFPWNFLGISLEKCGNP